MRPDLPQIMTAEYERDARFYEAQKHRLLKEAQRRVEQRRSGQFRKAALNAAKALLNIFVIMRGG